MDFIKVIDIIGRVLKKYTKIPYLTRMLFLYKDKLVFKKLSKYYSQELDVSSTDDSNKTNLVQKNSIIWTGWLQGEENAPDMVKYCLEKLRENSDGHQVVVISEENLNEFLPNLSSSILEKYHRGNIIPAHFMDLIRIKLLQKYGGAWFDATILVNKKISKRLFEEEFYSYKSKSGPWHNNPADSKWSSFLLAAKAGNYLITLVDNLLDRYWEAEVKAVDYFLLDYSIQYVYAHDKSAAKYVDNVPVKRENVFVLMDVLRDEYNDQNEKRYTEYTQTQSIFKLTYKGKFADNSMMDHLLEGKEKNG
ncbi:capsular polysaccharide synthesis protein [Pediococcus pentosaceus]|jgi:hypothetical protein|uniref:capsular polysaccharide synthesis protein n=1 Tax=Pediococcus pentosaceus TaxID=1255 RepID=UPI001E425929|nr:capsular polysaccharide synthesis protein [Pediococcus pentosaceus]MCI1525203.1 capsular polysaccharide synthesis protein [Lactobacillus crispatus]MCG7196822.1 capsular polysaccharide synthesis protein [Pediococcus pentosaceus]MCH4059444.1 capsular polysaccharide synthesis protein [Pediococcus pentosaceus]MCI2396779.1 capsular polysaccharide synthesis protein [Pediococcus pentosaceus]MCV3329445.1 capsular polysaccharide synthesis protein [Pediococcus pentosaceus]